MSPKESGLRPLMGYLLWQIQHGLTGEEALEAARQEKTYRDIPAEQLQQALFEALHNAAISEAAENLFDRQNIGEATGQLVSSETVFGVRVLIDHISPEGDQSVLSVVINAPASATVKQIQDAALAYAESGDLAQATGHASPGTFDNPRIFQVVEGGLPGARTTLEE